MKLTTLVLICILTTGFVSSQTYRLNRKLYDSKLYVRSPDDKYNPAKLGIASFVVPGAGQIIAGETGRGILFFSATTGSLVLMIAGAAQVVTTMGEKGAETMMLGLLSTLTFGIWSVVDAVKVAKVNNMYYQDLKKREKEIEVGLSPVSELIFIDGRKVHTLGVSLSLNF